MLVGQRADMNILKGSTQPKKSESLNWVFSHLQRTFLIDVLQVVGYLMSAQPTK